MAGFYGADTEQLRGFGDQVRNGGTRLEDMAGQLAAQVMSVDWMGPDAEAFRDDFTGRVSSLFDEAGGLLQNRRQQLERHAEEQDEASAPNDGGTLDAIGDAIGDVIDDAVAAGQGIWDFLNSTGFGAVTDALNLALSGLERLTDARWVKVVGNVVGRVLAPLGVVGGVDQMFNTEYEGWRGIGDRIAGGLNVIAGVSVFIPGGQLVAGITGGIAAAWNLTNAVVDNWDSITSTVSDFASDAVDLGEDLIEGAGDFLDGAGDFVSGLF